MNVSLFREDSSERARFVHSFIRFGLVRARCEQGSVRVVVVVVVVREVGWFVGLSVWLAG